MLAQGLIEQCLVIGGGSACACTTVQLWNSDSVYMFCIEKQIVAWACGRLQHCIQLI